MDKNEKLRFQLAIDQADTWAKQYAKISQSRAALRVGAAAALKTLRGAIVGVNVDEQIFSVLPLGSEQLTALSNFAQFIGLAPITKDDSELLQALETEIPHAVAEAQRGLASRRPSTDDLEAAEYVKDYASWGLGAGLTAALERISPPDAGPSILPDSTLNPAYGLAQALKGYGRAELVPASEIRSRLATFTAAARYAQLARSIKPDTNYLVVCSPAGKTLSELFAAIEVADN